MRACVRACAVAFCFCWEGSAVGGGGGGGELYSELDKLVVSVCFELVQKSCECVLRPAVTLCG